MATGRVLESTEQNASEAESLLGAEQSAVERMGADADEEPWRQPLVGQSRALQDIIRVIRLVGSRRCTVLVTGETGTGKELIARALHRAGPRARFSMVAVNCSAIPDNLLEAELFGHSKGAFTGAVAQRIGRFEQADRGTLFLDEIADLPLELQGKLLRALQEREFQRLGSSETIRVDVRVIAASNVDLLERVRQGKFREDLYYRLNVVPIQVPPLRERPGDIAPLAEHFIAKVCRTEGLALKRLAPGAIERLGAQRWPGNVRQLENTIERAVILSGEREFLFASDFGLPAHEPQNVVSIDRAATFSLPDEGLDFESTVTEFQRRLLEEALKKARGNKTAAADMLRLKRTTLLAKLRSVKAAEIALPVA